MRCLQTPTMRGPDGALLKPVVQPIPLRPYNLWEQHGHIGQAAGKVAAGGLDHVCGAVPRNGRGPQGMAVQLDIGVGWRRPVRQHHIQTVQGKVTQQLVKLALMAQQTQMGLGNYRLQQVANYRLGQAIEMPTARRTAGALTASRTKAGSFSPS